MLIIPAIDLKDGKCVRLRQGRFDDATVFSADPVAMARRWRGQGARRLHLVDLDGAVAGAPVNAGIVESIVKEHPDLPVQIGGGIRNLDTAGSYIEAGVAFVIIGTAALRDPGFATAACERFPGQVIIGIDAKNGRVATEGWLEVSEVGAASLVARFAGCGASAIVHTDIARDGMMRGVNAEATAALAAQSAIPLIASGGVTDSADIARLKQAAEACGGAGIMGVIAGRALYEGTLDLARAQAQADGRGDADADANNTA
ncbi:MAG: 1-(5-phosphoribosyl)-5-[(5-phosphoribosylamino)methylideneamino]imidazole-4-carboxamide isomerase [Gammaproteobacteria bacterium]|nr:1-(5-phosphoribosyl)-5-[(5-phosphoribosylamino)methylideneamino]imidazole-4-carboxamide isomerase [Gammaproteobacteria bacterium]